MRTRAELIKPDHRHVSMMPIALHPCPFLIGLGHGKHTALKRRSWFLAYSVDCSNGTIHRAMVFCFACWLVCLGVGQVRPSGPREDQELSARIASDDVVTRQQVPRAPQRKGMAHHGWRRGV